MNQIDIRLLSEADAEIVFPLRLRALKEEPESFLRSYEEAAVTPIADFAKQLASSDDTFVLGAFNPKLIGMVGFFRRQGTKVRHKGTIWGTYVMPEARGNGAGSALMDAAIEHASQLPDLQEMLLTVVTTKTIARNLYLSKGFKIYGLEKSALRLGDRFLDEELMALNLNPR